MKLYKNVDICDLNSILSKGILSLDESGNNNWEEGKRAKNPTDCVYLFQPIEGKPNVFPKYGVALLEVEVESAKKSDFTENDVHKAEYIEYVTAKVEASAIKRVLIPEIFQSRLELPEEVVNRVEFCGMAAKIYGDDELEEASEEVLEMFAKTAPIENSTCFNFFRGIDEKNHLEDLYDIRYIFDMK